MFLKVLVVLLFHVELLTLLSELLLVLYLCVMMSLFFTDILEPGWSRYVVEKRMIRAASSNSFHINSDTLAVEEGPVGSQLLIG